MFLGHGETVDSYLYQSLITAPPSLIPSLSVDRYVPRASWAAGSEGTEESILKIAWLGPHASTRQYCSLTREREGERERGIHLVAQRIHLVAQSHGAS